MLKFLIFLADVMVKCGKSLANELPVISVALFDCNYEFVGKVTIPSLPELPQIIVRGPRVFTRIEYKNEYLEQYAYFVPVTPLFLW